ncbi:sulfatase-like hydrolase/transferase [Paenibacillus sp. GSMTC-2017]|uniref:sulfatase family protein n=1 Tax=Paenibacillus sp. GSMTC-2017 TaxID=2794350 RepID=UPI0018D9D527|nr:sulfatase-like hydrolase/transferase [Paenibacillus sp. GSMTC-2017]MBH5320195.1 sulfatase-like hydrolase/transferase [Paenibacillus sp. GSMTC-2017]
MSRPNILLITSDQQHWSTLGLRNPEIKTPNLDRLAKRGTTFNRAYCPNPTCTPSRSSLLTGQYPSQHGAWTLGTKLPEIAETIGGYFSNAGYRTGLIGKAHFQPLGTTEQYPSIESYPYLQDLEYWQNFTGPYYGFQHIELARNHTNEWLVGQHYALWMEEKGCHNWRDYFMEPTGKMDGSEQHSWAIPEKYHYDTWIAERTSSFLEQYADKDEPFFLWASFFDPHPPYLVPEPWDNMYDPDQITFPEAHEGEHQANPPHFIMTGLEDADFSSYNETGFTCHGMHSHVHNEQALRKDIAVYYGMISLMDKYIGRILDSLEQNGLADNTIVVFTSDHGHFYGHHGLIAKGPFHYEDLIRIPMIVRYPGHVPEDHTSEALQSLVDFAPTLLEFAGIPIPRTMTGVRQNEVWSGRVNGIRDHVICENRHEPTSIHLKTYVDERYKLTVYYNQTYGELFDLQEDPKERYNLWGNKDYEELKSRLLLKYAWAEMGKEPIWMPRISNA